MHVPSIDVYVSYRCNLRCKHCFLGDHLNSNLTYSFDELTALVDTCPEWGTEEVTLLGGEPTIYRGVEELVHHIQARGLRARLVTNGLHGFARFMDRFDGVVKPIVYFSIDGSRPEVHDAIRGKGTFDKLVTNIRRSRELGYTGYGILSVSGHNAHDVVPTLRLCNDLDLEHVNVHFVTNRGYATEESVISFHKWHAIRQDIEEVSRDLKVTTRADHSLAPFGEYGGYCSVRAQDNLMFYPDGRVFICAMFFDVPGAHAFEWRDGRLIPNQAAVTERTICENGSRSLCPAMEHVNPKLIDEAAAMGCTVGCIYEKVGVDRGLVTIETMASGHREAGHA
jgi:MoaA/NifB/PqqE/SkfB family radical SAM enzyme